MVTKEHIMVIRKREHLVLTSKIQVGFYKWVEFLSHRWKEDILGGHKNEVGRMQVYDVSVFTIVG